MLKPAITNASPMNGPAQINAVADFAQQGWRFRSGTASDRAALPTAEKFAGLVWQDTDGTKLLKLWDGTKWTPEEGAISYAAGISFKTGPVYLRKDLTGLVTFHYAGLYTFGLAENATIGTFPTGFRPNTQLIKTGGVNGGSAGPRWATYAIDTNGQIRIFGIGSTAPTDAYFEGSFMTV